MAVDEEDLKRAAARVGSILRGKYRLDRILGMGGMAVVYAATHRNRKRFAVKMLHPELSSKASIREKFIREGYVANTIEHPNALSVLDDDTTEDGAAFVVMELLDGLTLEQLAEKSGGKLPPDVTLAIAHDLLDVLAAAHARNIVHRDIKPANVFLLRDGTVKVLDFGIARLREADVAQSNTGMLLGTPAFLPPEQARGKASEIDHRTDLWAVGATMFTLLTGEHVHSGESAADFVYTAASQPARSITKVARDIPGWVAAIVDRSLAFSKADRWTSAAEMQASIAEAYASLFEEPISRRAIAALMGAAAPPFEGPPSAPRLSDFDRTDHAVPVFEATAPIDPTLPVERSLVNSTARPVVQMMPEPARPVPPPPARSPFALIAAAIAGAALVAGAFVFLRRTTPATPTTTVVTAMPSTPADPALAPAAPIASASVMAVASVAPPPVARPVAAAPPIVRSSAPRLAESAPPPAAPPTPAPSAVPIAKPQTPPPSCKPPFELDAQGNKHWKPECL